MTNSLPSHSGWLSRLFSTVAAMDDAAAERMDRLRANLTGADTATVAEVGHYYTFKRNMFAPPH